MRSIPNLTELTYEGNPISRDFGVKYLIITTTKIRLLDDEKITDLDFELAEAYYKEHNLEYPR